MQAKYNPKYHVNWAWSLAIKGAVDTEIADAFGVSVRTIHRWKKEHPEFAEMLSTGKDAADANVEKKLFERATGYDWEEKENIVEVGQDGQPKPLKVRTIKKHIPPDVMAQMYWLNNRKPDQYKRNPNGIEEAKELQISIQAMKEVKEFMNDAGKQAGTSENSKE